MIVRNAVTLPPTLNGSVVSMSKQAGRLADAAQAGDDRLGWFHDANVRRECTLVNLDYVRTPSHKYGMTIGTYLKELTARVAKGDELAKLLGYEGRSSLQKLLNPEYDTPLSSAVAKRFLRLEGKGSPPVRREEILAVCDLPAEVNASSDLDFATATAAAVARIASEGPLTEATIQSFGEIIRKVDQLRKQQPDLDQGHIETAIRALILRH